MHKQKRGDGRERCGGGMGWFPEGDRYESASTDLLALPVGFFGLTSLPFWEEEPETRPATPSTEDLMPQRMPFRVITAAWVHGMRGKEERCLFSRARNGGRGRRKGRGGSPSFSFLSVMAVEYRRGYLGFGRVWEATPFSMRN